MASDAEITAMREAFPEIGGGPISDAVLGGWLDEAASLYRLSTRGTQLCAAHLFTLDRRDKAMRYQQIATPDASEAQAEPTPEMGASFDEFFNQTEYGKRLLRLADAEIGVRRRIV